MKLLSMLLSMVFVTSCAQTITTPGYIKSNKFEGYVFPKQYAFSFPQFEGMKERYTPSNEEIIKAEQLLKGQISDINKSLINQGGDCPIIHSNLSKYKRQYIGYIDGNGDKIIWINFVTLNRKDQISRLDKDVIIILDGCSNYWNIKINLNKEKLYDLRVNGSA